MAESKVIATPLILIVEPKRDNNITLVPEAGLKSRMK